MTVDVQSRLPKRLEIVILYAEEHNINRRVTDSSQSSCHTL